MTSRTAPEQQGSAPDERERAARPVGFEDLLALRLPGEPALTPDGERYAVVVTAAPVPAGERARSALYVGETAGGRPRPLPGEGRDAVPVWSPDGTRLAFASDRVAGGGMQPYVREPDGAVRRLAAVTGDVEALRWSATGDELLALVAEPGSDRSGAAGGVRVAGGDTGSDPLVHRPAAAWRRLHRVPLDGGPAVPAGPDRLNVWEFDWHGGPQVLAVVSDLPGENAWYDAVVAVLDLDGGDGDGGVRTVHRPAWQVQSVTLGPDGTSAAFVEGYASDRGQGLGVPTRLDLDTGTVTEIDTGLDVQRLSYLPDGRLFYVGQRGVHTRCGLLGVDGERDELWSGPATLGRTHLHEAVVAADARLVLAPIQAPGRPPEVAVLDLPATPEDAGADLARWRPLTDLNRSLAGHVPPVVEELSWPTDDGTTIEGFLLRPATAPEGPQPLVVFAHGGPNNAWTLAFAPGYSSVGLPLVSRGYALLFPNQRGSTGRGQAFTRAHLGDYGGTDLRDVLAGVRFLAGRGDVDPARVGIIGGSAGGYLAAWAATAGRDAFAAAVPVACVSNWVSFHNTSNIPRLTEIEYGSDAYDPAGQHVRFSPVYHARGATTPTLVVHGELDTCTPLGQAQELYQALTSEGCEAELVVYPREGHSFRERGHLLDLWSRVSAWFDRHLRG